jgi:hypothetical protein
MVGRITRSLLTPIAFVVTTIVASPARAQDDEAPHEESSHEASWIPPRHEDLGFGKRAQTILSFEQVLGLYEESASAHGVSRSYEDKGLFPGAYGARLAFHGVSSSGVSYGARLGFWYGAPVASSSGDGVMTLEFGPRVGYAGAFQPKLGYWLRTGPTLFFLHSGEGAWFLQWSIETYLVWTPVEHFGVLLGPNIDIGLTGQVSSTTETFSRQGAGVGLLTDF